MLQAVFIYLKCKEFYLLRYNILLCIPLKFNQHFKETSSICRQCQEIAQARTQHGECSIADFSFGLFLDAADEGNAFLRKTSSFFNIVHLHPVNV
jgi:hypothetical protein